MSEEVDMDDLTEEDIERMSNEVDINEDIIKSSIQLKRADEKFNKYKNKELEKGEENTNKSSLAKIKNALIFIPNLFINTRHGPIKGKVTDIENPKNTDNLLITVTSEHNKIPDNNEKNADYGKINVSKKIDYDLKEDTEQIEYLLEKTGSENISDMVGKDIPIIVSSSMKSPTHNLPEKPYTIADKISNIIGIYGDYLKSREEAQPFESDKNGEYGWNLTFLLLGVLVSGVLGNLILNTALSLDLMSVTEIGLAVPGVMLLLLSFFGGLFYTLITIMYLTLCIRDLIFKEPGERYVIREVINS